MTNAGTPSEGITGLRRLATLSSASKVAAMVTDCGRERTWLLLVHRVLVGLHHATLRSSAHEDEGLFTEAPRSRILGTWASGGGKDHAFGGCAGPRLRGTVH